MNSWQQERDEQAKFGNVRPPENIQFQAVKTVSGGVKKLLPESESAKELGYMNFIRVLQEQKQEIVVIKADGEVVRGTIKYADAETISLVCPIEDDSKGRYRTRVLFKRQIAEFSPTKGIEDLIDDLVAGSNCKTA